MREPADIVGEPPPIPKHPTRAGPNRHDAPMNTDRHPIPEILESTAEFDLILNCPRMTARQKLRHITQVLLLRLMIEAEAGLWPDSMRRALQARFDADRGILFERWLAAPTTETGG